LESESTKSETFKRLVELARAEFWKEKRAIDGIYYKAIDAAMRVYEKTWDPDARLYGGAPQVAFKTFNERMDSAREARKKAVSEAINRYTEKVESLRDMMES